MVKIYYRIDDRLVHGQVIEGWVHNLGLTRIVIVCDRINEDKSYMKLLTFAVPEEVEVEILSISKAAEKFRKDYLQTEDTIVLFESPRDVLDLIDYGVNIPSINVGCMHYDGCNRKIKRNIAVNESDIKDFLEINSMGVSVECRSLPQDKKIDLIELLRRMK